MARLKKKPNYNSNTIMQELINEVSKLYFELGDNASIRQIANEFGMTPLKIRKLLITAGVFSSDVCDQVLRLFRSGKSVPEIQSITGLSRASVHSYLPYSKVIYNAKEISLNAERIRLYRERKSVVNSFREKIKECGNTDKIIEELWYILKLFENYPFHTLGGLQFTYQVKGNEIFVTRKEMSITRSAVVLSVKKTMELQNRVNSPEQLESFGASYLFPIFMRIGLIERVGKRIPNSR